MNALQTIEQSLHAIRPQFIELASANACGLDFQAEAGFAMQVIAGNDYTVKIALANPQSVIDAVTNVAAIGISLNPARKQAYLVPRKSKICLDISYMGLIDLAVATGSICWAQANLVRKNDRFVLGSFGKPPVHEYEPFATEKDRGPLVGAYVVVKTADGDYLAHTMTIESIHEIRDRSESWKAKKSGPWLTDEGEMAKKTVVKQAQKYWPKTERSGRVEQAIHLLNTDGEGFEKEPATKPGEKPAVYPEKDLLTWIIAAEKADNQEALKRVWQAGLAEIKTTSDMAAYNAFKAAVEKAGKALASAQATDVQDKKQAEQPAQRPVSPDAPRSSVKSIVDRLHAAKTFDQLNEAATLIDALSNLEDINTLNGIYNERFDAISTGATA